MAERGLAMDHTAIWRWIHRYGPDVHRRLRGQLMSPLSASPGRWLYQFVLSTAGVNGRRLPF